MRCDTSASVPSVFRLLYSAKNERSPVLPPMVVHPSGRMQSSSVQFRKMLPHFSLPHGRPRYMLFLPIPSAFMWHSLKMKPSHSRCPDGPSAQMVMSSGAVM